MNGLRFWVWIMLLFCGLTQACAKELEVTVLYDQNQGLKPEDRVYVNDEPIGVVRALEVDSDGRLAAHLNIGDEYRQMVTDQCRFYIKPDPHRQGNQSVHVMSPVEGGNPLSDGATVEGSSSLPDLFKEGGRELRALSEWFEEELERWAEEIRRLPEKEWYKHLERQLEQWATELEQAEEDVRRHFRQEVLPKLEESLKDLRKRFEEKGKEEDLKPLEIKLDKLRSV